jgi:hypothetical protein
VRIAEDVLRSDAARRSAGSGALQPSDIQHVVVASNGAPRRTPWTAPPPMAAEANSDASAAASVPFPWSPRLFPTASIGGGPWEPGRPQLPQPRNTSSTVNQRFWGSSIRFFVNGVDQVGGSIRFFVNGVDQVGGAITWGRSVL